MQKYANWPYAEKKGRRRRECDGKTGAQEMMSQTYSSLITLIQWNQLDNFRR